MSFTAQLQKTFEKEFKGAKDKNYNYGDLYRQRLIEFRREKQSVVRLDKPTNLARARKLGYKAKQGFVVARVRVRKGSGLKLRPVRGRRPKRMGRAKITRKISIQGIAENRASKKFLNCEVLNSYYIGEDGQRKYYEVILIDTSSPSIVSDKDVAWITEKQHSGRSERGLTSTGKKSRGLRNRGTGAEKVRPSLRAHNRQGN